MLNYLKGSRVLGHQLCKLFLLLACMFQSRIPKWTCIPRNWTKDLQNSWDLSSSVSAWSFCSKLSKSWCTWPTSPGGHGPAPLEQSVCLFWSVTLSWISKRNANKKQKSAYYTRHQWINVDRMSFDWRLDFANSSKVVLFVTCANLSRSNETACQQEILSLIANWDDTPTRISDLEHLRAKEAGTAVIVLSDFSPQL